MLLLSAGLLLEVRLQLQGLELVLRLEVVLGLWAVLVGLGAVLVVLQLRQVAALVLQAAALALGLTLH